MKLSVNEAKFTGLWTRNWATFQQVFKSFRAFSEKRATGYWELPVVRRPISANPGLNFIPGPSSSKPGWDNPGLVRDLNSDLKA